MASSLDDRDNIVDHVVCSKAEFLWHTVLSNEHDEFYTYGLYPHLIHILLTYVHLDCRGEGSSNRNASRDESVEPGDESVEAGDESIEAGEKQNNHVIITSYQRMFSKKPQKELRCRNENDKFKSNPTQDVKVTESLCSLSY